MNFTKTKLSFCTLLTSDNIIIAEINEGVVLNQDMSDDIIYFSSVVFKNNPFVYITNRINSYAVDPTIYKGVSQVETLKGFAVVSTTLSARNAEIERLFLNKPFEIFSDLEEAKLWAIQILNKTIELK
ncbi:hypothetical protein [Olleya marilimosa]|uniref:STAS/SEC14 domain-containing protein n=1 Tax=Olleya marilimosa TaxID=272164 RepID=A0ABR8LNQ5_9FLAO|nr:hypothetical protein [Olleya marilimosa]MBD3861859.1 hypothetical protein [Olleya marilimosa]MBD3889355.1 hypothetical protein [Olleya marilimosa]